MNAVEDDDNLKLENLLSVEGSKLHLSKSLNNLSQTIIHLAVMFASAKIIGILMDYVDEIVMV